MTTVLVVFFLSIRSSYARNMEFDASDSEFDTVQFYSADGVAWRIKTYAIDQDVHVWNLGKSEDFVALARASTEQHYGDVLTESYSLSSETGLDGIRSQLLKRGLTPSLEVSTAGFAFWVPEGTTYRTKSKPVEA